MLRAGLSEVLPFLPEAEEKEGRKRGKRMSWFEELSQQLDVIHARLDVWEYVLGIGPEPRSGAATAMRGNGERADLLNDGHSVAR